jgi:tryptophan synthase alpha chain
MNKINKKFKKKNIISIYFTSGYPKLNSTNFLIKNLEFLGVDLIEVGIPYSDPIADGITIQNSNKKSIKNGMNISLLFSQLKKIKNNISIPIVIMGYYNQFFQFGEKRFIKKCLNYGISGLILPDLPPEIYKKKYKLIFEKNSLFFINLVTPNTSNKRIRMLSNLSKGFLYLISSLSTTGSKKNDFDKNQIFFLKKIQKLNLKIPKLIGFGINNKKLFIASCNYAEGVIIGSAFIKIIKKTFFEEKIKIFIKNFQ